ncbi:MAG: hypothetical protein H0U19_15540 [Acidobacteria bacterium]|nr:hypothetical protein [Acidobacteriota bacterium]
MRRTVSMFTLRIVENVSPVGDPTSGRVGRRVQVWRDLADSDCAYGYAGSGWWAVDWLRIGTFLFGPAFGETVEVVPRRGVSEARIEDVYRRSVLPLVWQARGKETLHASAVTGARGVLAFCGERGAGKSTVAYGFSRRGFEQHADDTLVLTVGTDGVTTLPLPFAPRLRPASAQFFERAPRRGSLSALETTAPETLAALFILRPSDPPRPSAISVLAPAEAFRAVLAHAHCFDPSNPVNQRRLLQQYLEIAAHVPIFQVIYRPGLERLDALLDALLAAADESTPMSVAR